MLADGSNERTGGRSAIRCTREGTRSGRATTTPAKLEQLKSW